jgi:predicted NAD/FAD-binding protein
MPIQKLDIAVVGSGISGLAAAWLLSKTHRVTLFEKEDRPGGHSNTVETASGPVDTGFIVYNEVNYPNLTALFSHLDVPTDAADMSFGVSIDDGRLEYGGGSLGQLFAQWRNLFNPRFVGMIRDIVRFYREAPDMVAAAGHDEITLGDLLDRGGFGEAFRRDHLLPMAAAIWSSPAAAMLDYPARSFVAFCENHGLLRLSDRPAWRTVRGGSREYVARMLADMPGTLRLNRAIAGVRRLADGVEISDRQGDQYRFDHVVIAAHADQALDQLLDPSAEERRLLGCFRYQRNLAILHSDEDLMPRRRKVWSSWNYLARRGEDEDAVCVTYWMNRLQPMLASQAGLFVTLNPIRMPTRTSIHRTFLYDHPIFDTQTALAQQSLWSLQGKRNTWFCGAYFGAGFHEDGLQAGLAVAEALGGKRRPWQVADESGRIVVTDFDAAAERELEPA